MLWIFYQIATLQRDFTSPTAHETAILFFSFLIVYLSVLMYDNSVLFTQDTHVSMILLFQRALHLLLPQQCQGPIYTSVEKGTCGLMSCQRALVLGWDSNSELLDWESSEWTTTPYFIDPVGLIRLYSLSIIYSVISLCVGLMTFMSPSISWASELLRWPPIRMTSIFKPRTNKLTADNSYL